MTKNPYLNALGATLYIVAVSSFLFYGTRFNFGKDSVLAPIAMLSLLTLSAATMSYLFFYQPIIMYIEGKKKAALDFFLKTLLAFAGLTTSVFIVLFLSALWQR